MKVKAKISRAETAQLAMVLEVCAGVKPGNVDRFHDYEDTWIEHFLASAILAGPAFTSAEKGPGPDEGIGAFIKKAVELTNIHSGGNTHFGAFILLMPLVSAGNIEGASKIVRSTTVDDAVLFYEAFSLTSVRMNSADELDVNDPSAIRQIRDRDLTLYDVMEHSAANDMVAAEWTNGFRLTRKTADLLKSSGNGRRAIPKTFLNLLSEETDTFVIKKFGHEVAEWTREKACLVRDGGLLPEELDVMCLDKGINPGSIADIIIAGIYVALIEGWEWDS